MKCGPVHVISNRILQYWWEVVSESEMCQLDVNPSQISVLDSGIVPRCQFTCYMVLGEDKNHHDPRA